MALTGVRVLELVGLAPGPFCGKILADFGATVTRVDRIYNNELDVLKHGKRTLALNLKNSKGQLLLRRLSKQYDVLIEPFRPGVMEKLNLGPDKLCSHNPRLIYARLTGFGQYGRLAPRAGHDINYAGISGVLSMLGRRNEKPTPPINLLADFAGGGLMCALGICLALLERHRSGCGQVVDAAMVDGAAYAASWLMMSQQLPLWGRERGCNALDGGVFFYDTYETKDGRFMTVGALEPQFFALLKEKLELPQLTQFAMDDEEHEAMTELMRSKFLEKTQFEWTQIFEDVDACVYPVLELHEAAMHDHNKERQSFQSIDGVVIPTPAPRLSRTPGVVATAKNKKQEEERNGARDTRNSRNPLDEALEILKDLKLTSSELQELINDDVILVPKEQAKL